jgi:2-succinyl-5-enolpyruvyl-6-hydroxy-3-cyclohexene-1-carboxylate synthase
MTSSQSLQEATYIATGALVDELIRSGVRHFSVCPGSRSTPLALTVARHPQARLWMHLDERSAAYFGLGIAKLRREPVALICSSGTAAANFAPAVIEAWYARVPLIVLTADRPHELRDCGAAQAIDQNRLYGPHVKWFVDLPEPDATPDLVRYVRTDACEAVAAARRGPAGPVHLNCPYREPLMPPSGYEAQAPYGERPQGRPYVSVVAAPRAPAPVLVAELAGGLEDVEQGLIVCGPQDDPDLPAALVRLGAALGYPIVADPLSGLRSVAAGGAVVLDCYDAYLRNRAFVERFRPQVVLRFGAMPTSKPLLQYLERYGECRQIVVDGDAGWNEPTRLATEMLHVDGRLLGDALSAAVAASRCSRSGASRWERDWRTADEVARGAIAERLACMDELFEGKVFAELAELVPDGAVLFAGNSMPVRDLDTFFPRGDRNVRLLANRGASGIDGVVSSALGAGAVAGVPLVLAIGDLSFYHDSNGLLAARQHGLDAVIVLINNNGGGIFSFLSQTADPEHFEQLFGTPHGLDFRPLVEMYGARYTRVTAWEEFRAAVAGGMEAGGLHVVEVPSERDRNALLHAELWSCVAEALATRLSPSAAI